MNKPLVSVIIPNYNYGRYLPETIDSVLAQTYPNIEIIVVDDGSTDNSSEILAEYGDQLTVINQKNLGVGAARNTGARRSSGEYLAFLDADDIWLPQKIEKQVESLETQEDAGLVTCSIREFDTNTNETVKIYRDGQSGWCAEKLLSFEPVVVGPGSTALVKREIFDKTGGFDENKKMHPAEDWEFSYRAAKISKLVFIDEVLAEYRNHGNNGHLNVARLEQAMFLACGKIFDSAPAELNRLKPVCYGKAHSILAGTYFHAGQYPASISHAVKSFWHKPDSISRILGFPVRWIKRRVATK